MMIARRLTIISLVILALLFTFGCSQNQGKEEPAGQETAQGETIKIGGIGPLSPPGTPALGQELKISMQMAIDEVNEQGGLLGKKLELVFEDSQGTPEKGQAAMEKLITKDKVVIVAGEGHSSAALAELEVAHRNKVPFIIAEAWADKLTELGYPEVFRVAPNNSSFTKKILGFVEAFGFERIAIIAEDTDWGVGNVELLEPAFEQMGLQYQSMVVDRTGKDFVPQLLQIQSFKPDLLINMMTGVGSYLIDKQAYEIGLAPSRDTTIFMGGADGAYPEIWETVGEAGKYVTWQSIYHPKAKFTSKTEPFVKKYEQVAGRPPTYVALQGYDTALLIIEAIKQANGTDPDKMIAALENMTLEGTRGVMKFPTNKDAGPDFHNSEAPLLFLQYTELNQSPEDAEIIFPKEVATAELQFPSK